MDKKTEDVGENVSPPQERRGGSIATSPMILMIAYCACIAYVVGINMFDDQLKELRSDLATQPLDINDKVQALDGKIETLVAKLHRVERMALEAAEDDRPVGPCGDVAQDGTRRTPSQENLNDGRE